MTTILDKILAFKRQEVAEYKKQLNQAALLAKLDTLEDAPRGFFAALQSRIEKGEAAVIAEVKRASPSAGVIRENFDPVQIARQYAANGAACLSVLTDKQFFMGDDAYLQDIRKAVALPLLRKDFIIDEYQVLQARILGADAVLLIVAALSDDQLVDYTILAHELNMDVLVEVHDEAELERAMKLPLRMVGVNNRNLHDFSVDLQTSVRLLARLPAGYILVSESGIRTHEDIRYLQDMGVGAFLVGGSLMAENDPGEALHRLLTGD